AQSGGSTLRWSTSSAIASLATLPPSSKYSRLPDDIDFNQVSSSLVNRHPQSSTTIIEVSSMSLSHFFQVSKKAFGFVSRRGSQPNFTLPEELCIRQFSLEEIKAATANFDEGLILGISNFGSVYKGVMDNGTFTVAIRRMKFSLSAFRTEVVFLSQLNHLNVESLIGFCNEKGETILVYEYLSNGSCISCNPIPWEKRLQICIGAARGLHYLHTGAKYIVLHRNVTSNTILLDHELVPKLSGFFLSRLGPHSMSKASIKKESIDVVATFGYLDLEYLSGKNDVYAFGVVLLEVICGKISLPACANWCIENGTFYHNIDPYLKGRIAPECFNKYVEIA
ncbi:hypothetical protein Goklo_020458, partial [Gossypium klotzschianum]|nr:hypothetical protein [Gossypium klotzschianum]